MNMVQNKAEAAEFMAMRTWDPPVAKLRMNSKATVDSCWVLGFLSIPEFRIILGD